MTYTYKNFFEENEDEFLSSEYSMNGEYKIASKEEIQEAKLAGSLDCDSPFYLQP